jgi:hypothetical protein
MTLPDDLSTVFISYTHDSADHAQAVLQLSNRLRSEGIDCVLDQYESSPPEGWPQWMDREIKKAQFVVMVCTEAYYRRVMGEEKPGVGLGIAWEGQLIYNHIYSAGSRNTKFIPVIFDATHAIYIPTPTQGATRYCLGSPEGYEQLYSRLIGRPPAEKPPLGKRKALPRREVKTTFFVQSHIQSPIHTTLEMVVNRTREGVERRSVLEHLRRFHNERIAKIRSAQAPMAMIDSKMLVMHVVPFSTVDERRSKLFDQICRNRDKFRPIGYKGFASNSQINFDGLLIGSNDDGLRKPQRAYVYVLPTSAVEAVACRLGRGNGENAIQLPEVQAKIIRYARIYLGSLHTVGIELPMAVVVSLVGAKGMRLLQDCIRHLAEDEPYGPLEEDQLCFGEAIFETIPTDDNECAKVLRNPILDCLANTANLSSPPYFDNDGNYIGRFSV